MPFKATHYENISEKAVEEEGAVGARIRWLISRIDGTDNFALRMFTLDPGGQTPQHKHPWEHGVFVLEGEGIVWFEGEEHRIAPGYVVFIPPNKEHYFKNTGKLLLRFLCIIPFIGPERKSLSAEE
ncbi:cupin domain-containing protein [archaeon]|nr:cupin domain-containing protein [archaeon]